MQRTWLWFGTDVPKISPLPRASCETLCELLTLSGLQCSLLEMGRHKLNLEFFPYEMREYI